MNDTATLTAPTTHEVLAAMLVENTGTHMLDSGGASGRHWQRNQGLTVETLMERPEASWGYAAEYVVLDLFHYLRKRLEFAADVQAEFDAFSEGSEEPWAVDLEEFFAERFPDAEVTGGYTYNHENCLSQDFVWHQIDDDDSDWDDKLVVLQIHGGADARGGFTAPKFFRANEYWVYEVDDVEVACDGHTPTDQVETLPGFPDQTNETVYHGWSMRGGDVCDNDGNWVDRLEFTMDDDGVVKCPAPGCTAVAHPYAPEPSY